MDWGETDLGSREVAIVDGRVDWECSVSGSVAEGDAGAG